MSFEMIVLKKYMIRSKDIKQFDKIYQSNLIYLI